MRIVGDKDAFFLPVILLFQFFDDLLEKRLDRLITVTELPEDHFMTKVLLPAAV